MSQGKGSVFEAGKPHIMPAHFGTATQGCDGDKAHCVDDTALTVLYATDARKASEFLPPVLPWSRDWVRS